VRPPCIRPRHPLAVVRRPVCPLCRKPASPVSYPLRTCAPGACNGCGAVVGVGAEALAPVGLVVAEVASNQRTPTRLEGGRGRAGWRGRTPASRANQRLDVGPRRGLITALPRAAGRAVRVEPRRGSVGPGRAPTQTLTSPSRRVGGALVRGHSATTSDRRKRLGADADQPPASVTSPWSHVLSGYETETRRCGTTGQTGRRTTARGCRGGCTATPPRPGSTMKRHTPDADAVNTQAGHVGPGYPAVLAGTPRLHSRQKGHSGLSSATEVPIEQVVAQAMLRSRAVIRAIEPGNSDLMHALRRPVKSWRGPQLRQA